MLRMEQVVAGYGKAQVLHGIDLFIAPGEVVALVGPNGAGKTTTIRCITGEVTPRSGRVFYREEDLEGKTSHAVVARGISCSPEGRHIFGNLT
ncbi:MAG TPA: ATP-binding cassette domain-containing protein, partial [Synergistaceae bacterium]|nr:ATP-binding cassette domain-containing protein [Synergistaceae bacterium]